MKKEKLVQWLPGIASEAVAAVFCIIYAVTNGSKPLVYAELLAAALLPFAFPVYGAVSKKPLPLVLPVAAAVFVFFASDLGSGLEFYEEIYCWDLIMHGVSGLLCSLFVFVLLMRWNGDKLNPAGCMVIIFVFTMGVAALWEVWEYVTDCITGNDAQHVAESIASGKSPVADTMEDIMIAMAGSAVFFISLLADKFNGWLLYGKLCGFKGFAPRDGERQPDGGE